MAFHAYSVTKIAMHCDAQMRTHGVARRVLAVKIDLRLTLFQRIEMAALKPWLR